MATVTKPIALDESLNTTEQSSRNIADVLAQEIGNLVTVVSRIAPPTTVSWNQIEQSGTKIAEITINGTKTDVYAPQGGGGFSALIVVTDALAGVTITATKGGVTKTGTSIGNNQYEISVDSSGTWTISDGTNTDTVTVTAQTTYYLTLGVPDGSTVTPTDDIQTLLNCANIWDKSYTTLTELLSDSTSLQAVISSNNAIDYLVRSTTFASDVTADSTAMSYIGLNNYASNTLLGNATWKTAICNSAYFESVLNVKVPVMTSDNTPSGECSSSSVYSASYPAWKAFDGDDNTFFIMGSQVIGDYIRYKFARAVKLFYAKYHSNIKKRSSITYKIQGSNNASDWVDLKTIVSTSSVNYDWFDDIFDVVGTYLYCQITISAIVSGESINFSTLQFYGRADV